MDDASRHRKTRGRPICIRKHTDTPKPEHAEHEIGSYLPLSAQLERLLAYLPHSWHTLSANAGLRASRQQKIGFSRSSSQHGLFEVGEEVGERAEVVSVGEEVGQSLPRLVPPMPPVYDVPTEGPALTRR